MAMLILGDTEQLGEWYSAYKVAVADVLDVQPLDPTQPDGHALVTVRENDGTAQLRTVESAASVLARMGDA